MALIRQSLADRVTQEAIALDLDDLSARGEAIRAKARAEAEAILRRARSEREELLRNASEQGRAEGFKAGHAEGLAAGREEGRAAAHAEHSAELARIESAWCAAFDAFAASREALVQHGRSEAVELALLLAGRIVKRAIDTDPGIAAAQMEAVLALVSRRSRLRLRIHPDDEPSVRAALPGALARATLVELCDLSLDPTLERGSCIAATELGGEFDASIGTQLDRIAASLFPEQQQEVP